MIGRNVFAFALTLLVVCGQADAQWLKYKTPGIPRTADGKPNLAAPAPRAADGKPDLSGLWQPDSVARQEIDNTLGTIQAQPWAEALAKQREENLFRDSMSALCLPAGPRADSTLRKVIQTPNLIVLLYDDLSYRQVFLDGRELEADPNPAWMGYSVGHWEGDTLVVESNGFNNRTWLYKGYPHTEALHMTERMRRADFGHLVVERRLDDPKALVKPLAITIKLELDADTEMLEYVCNENERDRGHLVGTATDFKKDEVAVALEILPRYAGIYKYNRRLLKVSVEQGRLMIEGGPPGKQGLTPLSDTHFVGLIGDIEFITDDKGSVSHLVWREVEGDHKAVRQDPRP